jgi:signal transduction histidine kinase
LQQRKEPVLLDGSEGEMELKVVKEVDELRSRMPFEAYFPIASDDFLSGILVLGRREGGERYTEAELALLESTCLQIAVNLRARQLERRASQTEKLISLGTLAAGLAHELRNPLVSIQTFAALMKERGTDLDFQQEFGAIVQRDVSRIASIVENVAAFAESNRVQMSAVSLSEVLTAAAEIARPELLRTQVELIMPAAEAPRVTANYSQLLQVFLNLVQNAAQAMDGRPSSRLAIGYELQPGAPQPLLCVSLSDNGPGIDPALLPHIFDPFTTTKATGERRGKHGMGLGLAIVKRIVQHHHGEIQVTSVLGQGTTFRVYLPPAA